MYRRTNRKYKSIANEGSVHTCARIQSARLYTYMPFNYIFGVYTGFLYICRRPNGLAVCLRERICPNTYD